MNCRRFLSRFSVFPLLVVAALSGCGENTTSRGNEAPAEAVPDIGLYVTAPAAVTIATGTSPTYAIAGGTTPYTVSSSNTAVATASVTGTNLLTINGVSAGTAQILVFDAKGASEATNVTVSQVATTPLEVLPNGASANVGDVLTFKISGGAPGYTIVVNNPSIATVTPSAVTASGGLFNATLHNVGVTVVAVTDALGQTKTFNLTANQTTTLLRLSPDAFTVSETNRDGITLNIYGGTGPYTALTSDLTLSSVSVNGATITIGLGTQGSRCIDGRLGPGSTVEADLSEDLAGVYTKSVTITVSDALGASATSVMTIMDNYGIGFDYLDPTITREPSCVI